MGEEIYISLDFVPPSHRKRLNAAVDEMLKPAGRPGRKAPDGGTPSDSQVWCHLPVQGRA